MRTAMDELGIGEQQRLGDMSIDPGYWGPADEPHPGLTHDTALLVAARP